AELFHDKPARELVDAILSGREVEPVDLALDNRALLIAGRALPNGGALLVLRDVTDLRRLETVRRDFVANVSHELKTPLTSIAGYAETLTAEVGTGTQSERFAQTILSNARRMQRLVDDLLDLSRIESGGWQPTPESVDIATVARETLAPFADRVFERFYRADPARCRDQGGTGLGLAIVKHLVEAHGGWVDAQSAPGQGTTIRMVFPRLGRSL